MICLLLSSCTAIREMTALSKCQFRIGSVENTRLAGINIQAIRGFSDLSFGDAAKATAAFVSGNLPLNFTLNVDVKNPNSTKAAMNKFEWIALIDNTELLDGIVQQRVEVQPNGGVSTIPLNISVNLKEILSKLSKDQILNFGFGIADAQKKPTRVALKLKPSIMVANRPLSYPGYITVKREFTAN